MKQEGASRQLKQRRAGQRAAKSQDRDSVPLGEVKKHFDIDIYRAWCKSCGICAAFCPRECIRLDEEGAPVIEDVDRCTGCGWCELHCPDFAISVHGRRTSRPSDEELD